MIGLREDQRERAQLVGKINALFAQLRDGLVVSGIVVESGDCCGERACPALGCAAAPTPTPEESLIHRILLGWGCYAAQRGASPLATTIPAHHNSPCLPQ